MKLISTFAIAIFLFLFSTSAELSNLDQAKYVALPSVASTWREYPSAVFNLRIDGRTVCTAFAVVGSKGEQVLLSAGHCAMNVTDKTALTAFDAKRNINYPIKLLFMRLSWSETLDYAVFGYRDKVPPTALRTTKLIPDLGDPVMVVEGPLGYVPFVTWGFYSGLAGVADDPRNHITGMYWIQLPASPGSSGSPVLDRNGKVWGILVGGNEKLAGMALVVLIPAGIYGLG
jgi:S1-C subfamily serine protease